MFVNIPSLYNTRSYIFFTIPSGKQLELCFFDEWADKFTKYAENRESVGHVVMILQLARVKYFNSECLQTYPFFCIRHLTF